jgi:2,4-dienoyl-CoA reductase-like NADH-dependent reductase (Old Yellow Enzyme family)
VGKLFEATHIRTVGLRNRFVRSATVDNGAESGYVSDKQIRCFQDLARGGVGLVVTGMTCVHPPDHIAPFQNSLADADRIPPYKRLTGIAHDHGAKIAVQLVHAGRERGKFLTGEHERALAPSFVENDPYCETEKYRALTEKEIREIIVSFGDAAERAREAGFDAVQIHGAHAFLLSQFLSPHTNHRDDAWGGSLENRLRIHCEIYRSIRAKVGSDYPVLIKLGVQDGFAGGLEFEEGKQAAVILAQLGFDALEISQGLRGEWFGETEFRTDINTAGEAYFRKWCREVKRAVSVPVMMVGGLRTFALMEEIVRQGEADYISLCRPFIREPALVNTWSHDNQHKARCISCNRCIAALREGAFLHCVQEREKSDRGL